ncbi:Serine/threonine-protein kinase STK [Penicillium digitatum]|uniref:Serine/threonine-protein kinase STK n=1 Tax=Penicillium digitatum TaxID=36651 RepID=A0A7T6XLL5_PENDI|nr:Serine/threonine-protein kinase STK [Penicillium digitatum]
MEAGRTFTTKLLAHTNWSPNLCTLPAERESLTDIFGGQVTPDKFMTQQACFCPIVICNKTEVRVQSLDRQCLPYLEQNYLGAGAQGTVYRVKIAKRHFYDPVIGGTNDQPKEMARKDYQSTKDMERDTLRQILACDRVCPNIVDIYGGLAIGTNYSIFMPLALCDLSAYMREDHRTRPGTTMEKTDIIHSARGLARGLEFLHNGMRTAEGDKMVCYHLDIKPSNILVFLENVGGRQEAVWKISDFGMSRLKLRSHGEENEKDFGGWFVRFQQPRDASTSAASNRRGDGTYIGPESLSKYRAMREQSDVWSLGCILSVVFAYLEEGSSGVEKYGLRRLNHRSADGYDRFFVTDPLFGRPKINPAVTIWHDKLIKKARQRSSKEGEAVKSILTYLVQAVLQPEPSKRCSAQQLESKLLSTFRKYRDLGNEVSPHLLEEAPGLGRVLQRIYLDSLIRERQYPTTERRVEHWVLGASEPFKGCEISPDGTVIAFWTDTKLSLYTSQSLQQESADGIRSAAEYPIPTVGCRWKSISLTSRRLIASTSGGPVQCYIFKLPVGPYVDANLRPSDRVSLPTLPEIKKLALAPGSRRVACIVGDKVEDQNSGSLYFGDINYPSEWREKCKLDWPAADIVQLSFSTDDDLYMVFRPQRSGPNHKHEIPVIHVSFRSNQMCPLIIESQGLDSSSTVGLFTTFATFLQKPHVCVLVTREKQLHIQSLAQEDLLPSIQYDIKNYRVIKLMMAKNDDKLFAVGRRAAHHTMLLLEIAIPPQATRSSVTELAEIPGLKYSDEFAERIVHGEEESVVILAVLMGANQCRIYKITVPRSM